MLLEIQLLGSTFWCGSDDQAATAQMHPVDKTYCNIVECPPLLGALPLSLTVAFFLRLATHSARRMAPRIRSAGGRMNRGGMKKWEGYFKFRLCCFLLFVLLLPPLFVPSPPFGSPDCGREVGGVAGLPGSPTAGSRGSVGTGYTGT